jgi:hypothetical protein
MGNSKQGEIALPAKGISRAFDTRSDTQFPLLRVERLKLRYPRK